RAEDAVQAEEPAIDVVAEEDEERLGRVLGIPLVGSYLLEEVGLHGGGLEAAVAAVEIAEDRDVVARAGLDGVDIDVAVEEGGLAREGREGLALGELARARGAQIGEHVERLVEELAVGLDLFADHLGIRGVVELEVAEERRRLAVRRDLHRLVDRDALAGVFFDLLELEAEIALEELDELVAELELGRVHVAVGLDELVHRVEQDLLVLAVEALEDLEAAELELGLHEGVDVLVAGDGFGEELRHLLIDALEDLERVRGALLGELVEELARDLGVRRLHAVPRELPYVAPDVLLLRL